MSKTFETAAQLFDEYKPIIDGLQIKLEAAEKRIAELEAFKAWVHQYLDEHKVPHHPPGVHGASGCRIGDRMDWLMQKLAQLAARQEGGGK